jgi:cytochrome P450
VSPNDRVPDWDPLAPDAAADPICEHARLRAEAPVAYSDRWGGFWGVSRYEDVVSITRDPETFSSSKASVPLSTGEDAPPRPPLEMDPPHHDGYRRLLNPYFAPRYIRRLEPEVRRIAVDLVERVLGLGEADVVPELTFPMPVRVLCAFLGLPTEDSMQIKTWANDVIDAATRGDAVRHREANENLYGYIRELVDQRRREPREPSDDLVSGLLFGTVELEPLDDQTVAGILRLLLAAGHGTTTNGLGSTLNFLAQHPAEQGALRADPGRIPLAIEEILRLWSPSRALGRKATKDVTVGGRCIRAGEKIALIWTSANRDETAFPNADQAVIGRHPNQHVAFGHGVHTCLGAPLARMELRILAEEMLTRTRSIMPSDSSRMAGWPHIGPDSLPLKFERA